MEKAQAERRLDELHEYIRHSFTLFIGWFTFFGTVNFAAMGWMGASMANGAFNRIAWLVPVMFITQNICGLAHISFGDTLRNTISESLRLSSDWCMEKKFTIAHRLSLSIYIFK
jgi:hypothetical protein